MAPVTSRAVVLHSHRLGETSKVVVCYTETHGKVRLVAKGTIQIKPLIKDVVPIADTICIYDTLRDTPNALLGTVFAW